MNFEHVSVMLMPTVDMLDVREGGIYVDGTLGGGGHSAEILRRLNGTGHLYGIDRDNDALAAATERLGAAGNFTAVKGNFHDVKALLAERGVEKIDGMMIDLGVSSHQLDTAERGFSYHADAPLDMRMDQDQPLTAREIVNTWSAAEITRILRDYSEEKWAARIAQIIWWRAWTRPSPKRCACRTTATARAARFKRCASRSTTSWTRSKRRLRTWWSC